MTAPIDENVLAKAMKEEARSGPGFSPVLHDRIMTRIKDERSSIGAGVSGGMKIGPSSHWKFRAVVRLTLAALMMLCVGFLYFDLKFETTVKPDGSRTQITSHILDPFTHQVMSIHQLPNELATPVLNRFNEGKYGYLDRDAQRLQSFVERKLTQDVAFIEVDRDDTPGR